MSNQASLIKAIAFLIQGSSPGEQDHAAKDYLKYLAEEFELFFWDLSIGDFKVFLVSKSRDLVAKEFSTATLQISSNPLAELDSDRFLEIKIQGSEVIVRTDYAGTVPAYLGKGSLFSLTNIYPVSLTATKFSAKSIDSVGLYALMKYGHTIENETTSCNITSLSPNSTYVINSNATITSSVHEDIRESEVDYKSAETKLLFLRELNSELVAQSLKGFDQVILPLSSGYDSRLILAAIGDSKSLRQKALAVTYGPRNSMEVVAGRELAEVAGISWQHIELDCDFLNMKYQREIASIFGSSLHMHGMYQLEFIDALKSRGHISQDAVLTSGFMTGVPAGQHVKPLNSLDKKDNYGIRFLGKFSQSKYWGDGELEDLFERFFPHAIYESTSRTNNFNIRAGGSTFAGQILFDLWTRQRNFISYYPRTLEWKLPVISPHMNPRWLEYFLSLPQSSLLQRRQVVNLFKKYYPGLGRIPSNSSHFSRLGNPLRASALLASRSLNHLNIKSPLPLRFQDAPLLFDQVALTKAGKKGVYPLLDLDPIEDNASLNALFAELMPIVLKARDGHLGSYNKLVGVQALAWDLLRATS